MTTNTNGHSPGPEPLPPQGPDDAALRQQQIEMYIKELVHTEVQSILARQGSSVPASTPAPTPPDGKFSFAGLISAAPALAEAFIGVMETWTRAKIAANPLGHLDIIAQTHPRLMALYAPNPLGEQFTNIYANAFIQGMTAARSGRTAGALPAPLAPSVPSPSLTPGTIIKPSTAPQPSPGLGVQPGTVTQPVSDPVMQQMPEEQFLALTASIRDEYLRRYARV